jgi:tripartite-type tricarboxylate transporter receptor subunit TctC
VTQRTMRHALAAGILGALAFAGIGNGAIADPVSDFYTNRTVTIVIAGGPGGGHTPYALLINPHLQSRMPGNPNFIIQHMPGAGGVKAANYLYNVAPRDGTHVGMLLTDTPLTARLRNTGVKYKPSEFAWLAAAENVRNGFVLYERSGLKSLADARTKSITLGSTGKGSQTFIVPTLVNAFVGTRFKVVTGYAGMGGIYHAIDLGEVDGFHSTISTVKAVRPQWLENGLVRVLAVTAMDRPADYPDAPLLLDFIKDPLDRQAIELISGNGVFGRAWLTTPGVQADRVAALRAAFEGTVFDAAVIADATKRRLNWEPLKWPVLQKQAERIANADEKIIEHIRTVLKNK